MRAITIRQPWATAIVRMGKDVENRSRNIAGAYRGPVAIHAGSALPPGRRGTRTEFDGVGEVEYDLTGLLLRSPQLAWPYRLPLGVIIGVVDLVDVHHADDCWRGVALLDSTTHTEHCSPWAMADHHHLVLTNPRVLDRPIPWRGKQGLWTLPDDVLAGAL